MTDGVSLNYIHALIVCIAIGISSAAGAAKKSGDDDCSRRLMPKLNFEMEVMRLEHRFVADRYIPDSLEVIGIVSQEKSLLVVTAFFTALLQRFDSILSETDFLKNTSSETLVILLYRLNGLHADFKDGFYKDFEFDLNFYQMQLIYKFKLELLRELWRREGDLQKVYDKYEVYVDAELPLTPNHIQFTGETNATFVGIMRADLLMHFGFVPTN